MQAGRRYVLDVEREGGQLTVRVDGHVLGVGLELPEKLYAGITGCEGHNRFYEFELYENGKMEA